ncbi:hypothetical protein KZ810_15535 [Sphingomonas sp. RHCKR47]|uniref:hypothetical protein n=1 Tax=Sphingomonas citricola TaxID=2862498 RepID=UPI001CA4C50E|nr:hypothetical protein [Sphingomonas citricola]MBW6524909.1 hypothetical protein [Sphingomonas citricola]
MLDIACRIRGEARTLASRYVTRYGADALVLARMARADVSERGRADRALLYDSAITLLSIRGAHDGLSARRDLYPHVAIAEVFASGRQHFAYDHRRMIGLAS